MKRLFSLLFVSMLPLSFLAQARIILNGGMLTLQEGGIVVIHNSNPNAITVLNSSSGILINDATSRLRWHIGTTSDNFSIPFRYSNILIPLNFGTSEAVGTGYFDLSTYHVPDWKNSDHLPPGVGNVNRNGLDNSNHVLDRFWLINALAYTTKPTLSNLSFGYVDAEWSAVGNEISEPKLKAQRWNSILNIWSDYAPSGVTDIFNDRVTIASVSPSDLFEWWTLVDADFPLFDGASSHTSAELRGSRSTEINTANIRLYPNPVINTLTVYLGKSDARELQIIDAMGKKLYHQLVSGNMQNINLSHLPAGTYILQLMKGDTKWSYKIVKH